jgi:MFS family permease
VILLGPVAGVILDRLNRKYVMITSDLVRAAIALAFILCVDREHTTLLYVLSALLMGASPFFTAGRAAILPTIATRKELHPANSLTQLTQWTSVTIGSFLGGTVVTQFGYELAFFFNSLSFLFSAWAIANLRVHGRGFKAERRDLAEDKVVRPWHEYMEGLRYMKQHPLILGIGLVGVGWATGGGAAQILFSVFGESVFHRGPAGIGAIWSCAGLGLIAGAGTAHLFGRGISFIGYKRVVSIAYLIHGGSYVIFSQMRSFGWALFFIGLSRAAVAVSSVLNMSQLLRHVPNDFRGRVFATNETMSWSTMMLSMFAAGLASTRVSPRTIGAWAGFLSSTTGLFWAWANLRGRLPEPKLEGVEPKEVEVHGDPTV